MLEAAILALVLTYALKKGWEDARTHYQTSKAAHMARAQARRPGTGRARRTAAAARHDLGYTASQIIHGFPQVRHGIAAGWHTGRTASVQLQAARQKAKADHLQTRATLLPEIREHIRRQQEAADQIRRHQGRASQARPGQQPGNAAGPGTPSTDQIPPAPPAKAGTPPASTAGTEGRQAPGPEGSPRPAAPEDRQQAGHQRTGDRRQAADDMVAALKDGRYADAVTAHQRYKATQAPPEAGNGGRGGDVARRDAGQAAAPTPGPGQQAGDSPERSNGGNGMPTGTAAGASMEAPNIEAARQAAAAQLQHLQAATAGGEQYANDLMAGGMGNDKTTMQAVAAAHEATQAAAAAWQQVVAGLGQHTAGEEYANTGIAAKTEFLKH